MKLLLTLATALTLVSCATTNIAPPAPKGSVDHIVLVRLKRPGNEKDRQAVRAAGDDLRSIPGLKFLDHGTPLASDRPVVDDSFDVGFVMRFDSTAALDTYEDHPTHVEKVKETLLPLSRKIVVYDIIR